MCQMRTTHTQTNSPIGSKRVSSFFMEATGGSVKMFMGTNDLTQPQHRDTQERTKETQTQTDRLTDRNTHTHTHTHTPVRLECNRLGTSWWFP